jgi:uncharacterized membrane protein YkvA (DUF1232 family)
MKGIKNILTLTGILFAAILFGQQPDGISVKQKVLKLLFQMIIDKNYLVSAKTYAIIAGALAYVVLPFDVIPDFLPGVGFIDDAFIITMVVNQLRDEIENYKKYKNEKKS